MDRESGWDIDVKNCSHEQLVELLQQLEGSEHQDVQLEIRRELVDRLRKRGMMDARIIDQLIWGVGSRLKRDQIAKAWAPALGISVKEFNPAGSPRL